VDVLRAIALGLGFMITALAGAGARVEAAPRAARLELTFAGDVMFGGFFGEAWARLQTERYDPLADIERLLASDLPVVNLETTVMRVAPRKSPGPPMRFVATPAEVGILPRHGVRTVTVANNHAADLGAAGLVATPALLAELGITALGVAHDAPPWIRVQTVEVRGWRVGFVAATAARNYARGRHEPELPYAHHEGIEAALLPVVAAARADHDLVVVFLHWGTEFSERPSRWQVHAAHAFVDAGADAVIGAHPHVLQGIERYHGAVIAYSLGNFLFQNATVAARDAGVLRLGFRDAQRDAPRCLDRVVFHPTIEVRGPIFHPVPATGRGLREVAQRLITRSRGLGTTWTVAGEDLTAEAACR
jgi:poly-gamma-glutamate synthesis protein (capsule biosynthesis protein)